MWNPISTSMTSGILLNARAHPRGDQAGGDRVDTDTIVQAQQTCEVHGQRDHDPAFDEPYPGTITAERNADIETMLTTLAPPGALLALSRST